MPAVVTMDKGSIMGYEDNGIYTFKGVPYGTHERFKYATLQKHTVLLKDLVLH